ncbi:MAG: tetraacyldisaccharide 4'-kinase, partial [Phycisphaerae bacterium]
MEQWYYSIITGQRAGAIPAILRAIFAVLSVGYTGIVQWRNFFYDRGIFKTVKLPVPVISVGNITTGGTGKTPTVIMVVKELQRLGMRPAVLTRGYGAGKNPDGSPATPDEVAVIQRECMDATGNTVPVVVNPHRVNGGREAIARFGANVLVMDDGFQHRRLYRDLNIVLVDATAPLGVPGVLPRGSWREPPRSLARANIIMVTRCEQVSRELADYAANLLTQWVTPRDIYQQRTEVLGLFDSAGQPVILPPATPADPATSGNGSSGPQVLAFAGIGNPESFVHTLRSLNLHVSAACWFDDHHLYRPETDFTQLRQLTAERNPSAWVTTLKDLVKLESQNVAPGKGEI